MISFGRILCPIDFSDTSRRALSYAAAFAHRYDGRLEVLHVLPPEGPRAPREELLAQLHEAIVDAGSGTPPSHPVLENGRAHDVIVQRARSHQADLLVMGTHGRSGFNRLLLGSVTEKVVRLAPCPVLTVPPSARAAQHTDVVFKQILCAVDFSPSSLKALRYASELGRQADGAVAALHAIEYMDPYTREFAEPSARTHLEPELGRHLDHLLDETRTRLHTHVEAEAGTGSRIDTVVVTNRGYKAVLARAAETGVDLIVMGAQGHAALDVMLYGSTTQHVVRAAACPVLTVRA